MGEMDKGAGIERPSADYHGASTFPNVLMSDVRSYLTSCSAAPLSVPGLGPRNPPLTSPGNREPPAGRQTRDIRSHYPPDRRPHDQSPPQCAR